MPGTEPHTFLTILDALKSEKHKVSKKTLDMIEQFRGSDQAKLKLRAKLQQFDGASEKDRRAILQYLSDHWAHPSTHYSKPADLKRKEKKVAKRYDPADHAVDTSQILLTDEAFIKEMIDHGRVTEFHPSLVNKVDFAKLSHDQFRTFVHSVGDCAEIVAPSFIKALSNYHSKCYKDNQYYSMESHLLAKLTLPQLEALGKANRRVKGERDFIGTVFKKKFHSKLDPDLSLEERRDVLIELYEGASSHDLSLRHALLWEILDIGTKLDTFD